ncbi:DUF4936 family protein [Roseateles sp. BYS180W]|uniref:DUF4936 family protein n=1 Tax=Roseateles rivi TaxID=3299028 RepID=A0ABW7FXP4_9BURK
MPHAQQLYVYYRLDWGQTQAAHAAFARATAGAAGVRLLQRVEASALQQATWMEIYEDAQAAQLEPQVAAALQPWIAGPRHIERFAPL